MAQKSKKNERRRHLSKGVTPIAPPSHRKTRGNPQVRIPPEVADWVWRLGGGPEGDARAIEKGFKLLEKKLKTIDFRSLALFHVGMARVAVDTWFGEGKGGALEYLAPLLGLLVDGSIKPSVVEAALADLCEFRDEAVVRRRAFVDPLRSTTAAKVPEGE